MAVEKTRIPQVTEAPPPAPAPLTPAPGTAPAPAPRAPVSLGKFSVTPNARFGSVVARPAPSEAIATSVGTRSLDEHLARAVEHFDSPADPRFQAALGIAYTRVMS